MNATRRRRGLALVRAVQSARATAGLADEIAMLRAAARALLSAGDYREMRQQVATLARVLVAERLLTGDPPSEWAARLAQIIEDEREHLEHA